MIQFSHPSLLLNMPRALAPRLLGRECSCCIGALCLRLHHQRRPWPWASAQKCTPPHRDTFFPRPQADLWTALPGLRCKLNMCAKKLTSYSGKLTNDWVHGLPPQESEEILGEDRLRVSTSVSPTCDP